MSEHPSEPRETPEPNDRPASGHEPGYGPPSSPSYPPPSQGPGYAPGGQGPGYGPGGQGQPYGPPPAYGPPPGYGPAPGYGPGPVAGYGPRPGSDDTTMAMLAHVLGLLTSFVGPLILYLVKKDESPFVRRQAAEALNFQITVIIAYIVSFILTFILIGIILFFAVGIAALVLAIMAALAANRGEDYRYPINIRMVS